MLRLRLRRFGPSLAGGLGLFLRPWRPRETSRDVSALWSRSGIVPSPRAASAEGKCKVNCSSSSPAKSPSDESDVISVVLKESSLSLQCSLIPNSSLKSTHGSAAMRSDPKTSSWDELDVKSSEWEWEPYVSIIELRRLGLVLAGAACLLGICGEKSLEADPKSLHDEFWKNESLSASGKTRTLSPFLRSGAVMLLIGI